jgi:hypothetical protein
MRLAPCHSRCSTIKFLSAQKPRLPSNRSRFFSVWDFISKETLNNAKPSNYNKLIPLKNFSLTIVAEDLQNLGLCSALMAFEQGGIFVVPHLL